MMLATLLQAAPGVFSHLYTPLTMAERYQHTPSLIVGVLDFCMALAFLACSRAAPDFRVFRTTGAYYLLLGIEQFWIYHGGAGAAWAPRAIAIYLLVEMAAEAMRIPHHRWTMWFAPVYVASLTLGWLPQFAYVREWPFPCSIVALSILIFQGFRYGTQLDRLIATAFTIHFFARLTAIQALQRWLGFRPDFSVGRWHWGYASISQTLLGLLTMAVFVRALVHDRTEKQRMASELAAGRAVQQVLISEAVPATPGWEVESAYKPFGEVGGDFFQILPQPDGSVLVAIGDVSGKGIGAAMMVSLVVGTLHTLAETMVEPGRLLAGLNRRVLGRSAGGFTTCLMLRAETDGTVTMANAGHIAPYCEGHEVPLENGFPLGLDADAVYPETRMELSDGAKMTLVTDGVVEARNKAGELFGFARTEELSRGSAEAIVYVAQGFGQDDDITALTIMRTA